MKCEDVGALLPAYLDNELTGAERATVKAHLTECLECKQELAAVETAQKQLRVLLKRQATQAVPPGDAWSLLEARLVSKAHLAPSWLGTRLSRLAADANRASAILQEGVFVRNRRLAAVVVVLGLALVMMWMLRTAAPVSAQEILTRSAVAQQSAAAAKGIRHTRTELYQNPEVLRPFKPNAASEGTNIREDYFDAATGRQRSVITDKTTGHVTYVSGYDGTYIFSSELGNREPATGALVIYRTPQSPGAPDLDPKRIIASKDDLQQAFAQARQDPNAQVIGQETWSDGRTVYILQTNQHETTAPRPNQPTLEAEITTRLYFDIKTWELVGQQASLLQDGKPVIFSSSQELSYEILPAAAQVAWDLSDLQGVTIADNPEPAADQLPVVVSVQEVTRRTNAAYMLRAVPDGFTMRITAPPHPQPDAEQIYMVEYRNASGNFFLIQGGIETPESVLVQAQQIYTTKTGFKVYVERTGPENSLDQVATVRAPNGATFLVSSKLPRGQMKEWLEDLVPIK